MQDNIFSSPLQKQFEFDENVALVFDDMLDRSVPFYKEVLLLTISFIDHFIDHGDTVIDLGCSTASTLVALAKYSNKTLNLVGIDNATAMINQAKKKATAYGVDINFIDDDFLEFDFSKSKAIIANYTLQFVRPRKREKLVAKIYKSLKKGGVFVFSEKLITNHTKLDKIMIEKYFEYKKSKGYSEFEISSKREALENVLVPYSEDENKKMILDNGFKTVETIFRWNNFATFIALKDE
jgi:tRNA (cmo5U34)-methyltransferase